MVLAGALALAIPVACGAGPAAQPVDPLRAEGTQQIEVLRPETTQEVEAVVLQPDQDVRVPEPVSPARRAASTAGKVVLGIAAAGIAVGAALASLLLV